jgi:NaMN:DMB phosphoribosyltransferase
MEATKLFYLFISGTEISKIPGLSAAGANPEIVPLTSPADADVIRFGFPRAIDCFPMDPDGHPTPAIITRAAVIEANIPVCVVRAGAYLPPAPPYIETGAEFGADPTLGPAVRNAKAIYENSKHLAQNITSSQKMVMIGESIPGGTPRTTGSAQSIKNQQQTSKIDPSKLSSGDFFS